MYIFEHFGGGLRVEKANMGTTSISILIDPEIFSVNAGPASFIVI